MTCLAGLTATELIAAYRGGSVSPVEVARAALAAIDAGNADVNAFQVPRPSSASTSAHAAKRAHAEMSAFGIVVITGPRRRKLDRIWTTSLSPRARRRANDEVMCKAGIHRPMAPAHGGGPWGGFLVCWLSPI